MSDGTYRRLAESVLVAHQRLDLGNCLCGRLQPGQSWAVHVVGLLDEVGALRDRPPEHKSHQQEDA